MNLNHLSQEKSPYLLAHAYNPVDWYPWGKAGFDRAGREDKPIFLSIGYSTCHWCHVMEKESFEDKEVADVLNQYFISIKVDREERADIDAVYMSVCQALTGSGGWPLSILMTPDQKPFYAATYLPKQDSYGQPGLLTLLREVHRLWIEDKELLLERSKTVLSHLETQKEAPPTEATADLMKKGIEEFKARFDRKNGGFGSAPKFPCPHNLLFLLHCFRLKKDFSVLDMAVITLKQMARGGIYDQIGGGFSRYSTDREWLVPHFEKMLYDNALLAYTYLSAFLITKEPFFEKIARETLQYVLNELTDKEGGFYSGQDADSEGIEGKYYLFSADEIIEQLGKDKGELFCRWFSLTKEGNFEGKNICNLLHNSLYSYSDESLKESVQRIYEYRKTRTILSKDDKILTSWNSLMIAAFAKAYRVFREKVYLKAAVDAYHFLNKNLMYPDGRLLVRFREGEGAFRGRLEEYAFYAYSLLELYQAKFEVFLLEEAVLIAKEMLHFFFDMEKGGFYLYAYDAEQLISRPKETYDGAIPSGNSVAALVLERLFCLTGDPVFQKAADSQFSYLAGISQDYPSSHGFFLLALLERLAPSGELICCLSEEIQEPDFYEWIEKHHLSVLIKTKENQERLSKIAPFTSSYPLLENENRFYLCKNKSCLPPVRSLSELYKLL